MHTLFPFIANFRNQKSYKIRVHKKGVPGVVNLILTWTFFQIAGYNVFRLSFTGWFNRIHGSWGQMNSWDEKSPHSADWRLINASSLSFSFTCSWSLSCTRTTCNRARTVFWPVTPFSGVRWILIRPYRSMVNQWALYFVISKTKTLRVIQIRRIW